MRRRRYTLKRMLFQHAVYGTTVGLLLSLATPAACQGMNRVGQELCVAISLDGTTCTTCDNRKVPVGNRIPIETSEKCPTTTVTHPSVKPSPKIPDAEQNEAPKTKRKDEGEAP